MGCEFDENSNRTNLENPLKRILYDVSRWHLVLHQWARELKPACEDDKAVRLLSDELFEKIYAGGNSDAIPEAAIEDAGLGAWARGVHAACEGAENFENLVRTCRGDADATAAAVEMIVKMLKSQAHVGNDADPAVLRSAVRGAVTEAEEGIDEVRELAGALSGVDFGADSSNPAASPSILRKLVASKQLREIAKLAGRFKRAAAQRSRSKVRHSADEVVDIELGSDLARLLPSELAKLAKPGPRRRATLRDLAEGRCLQYRLQGTDDRIRGPIVLCLDKSFSMLDQRDAWASACALALLEIAHRERRPFALLLFCEQVVREFIVPTGSKIPIEGLQFPCTGGGTDITGVLRRALEIVEAGGGLRDADVIIVSDGESSKRGAKKMKERARALGATVRGVAIDFPAKQLLPWCDEAVSIEDCGSMSDQAADVLLEI